MPPPALLDPEDWVREPAHCRAPESEVDWTQLTPRVLRQLVAAMTPHQLSQWQAVKGRMVMHMFERLARHVRQFQPHTLSDADLRTFWEKGWMMQEAFLPRLIRPLMVTNERFGYVLHQRWHEWDLPSAKVIRYYWNELTQGLNAQCHHRIRTIGSELFFALPGPHCDCTRCGWTMPASEMWNETVCSYCHHREGYPYTRLTYLQGVPMLLPHESPAVKADCQLMRKFQTLQLHT